MEGKTGKDMLLRKDKKKTVNKHENSARRDKSKDIREKGETQKTSRQDQVTKQDIQRKFIKEVGGECTRTSQ